MIEINHHAHVISYSSDQAGEYKCKVSQVTNDEDVISTLPTKSVFVNVSCTPVIIQQQPPALLEIKEGEDFTISCIAHSHPEPHYQWFRDNTKLEGKTSNVLHVSLHNVKTNKLYIYLVINLILNVSDKTI